VNGASVLFKTEQQGDLTACLLHVTDSKLLQHRSDYDIRLSILNENGLFK